MSTSETLAAHVGALHAPVSNVDDATSSTHQLAFIRERWQGGVLALIGSTAMVVSGAFLLSQIPQTPGLQVQLRIIGWLMVGGGLWMVPGLIRDLFGRLVVDDEGIHLRPAVVGFSAPWAQIERWALCDDPRAEAILPTLKVYEHGSSFPKSVPAGFLSHHDQLRLKHALAQHLPKA